MFEVGTRIIATGPMSGNEEIIGLVGTVVSEGFGNTIVEFDEWFPGAHDADRGYKNAYYMDTRYMSVHTEPDVPEITLSYEELFE